MSEIKISKENLDNAHKNGCKDVKETLEWMFPEHFRKKGRAQSGERYWVISTIGTVNSYRESFDKYDDTAFNLGNYFHTKEQAEMVLNGVSNGPQMDIRTQADLMVMSINGLKEFFKSWQRHFGIID